MSLALVAPEESGSLTKACTRCSSKAPKKKDLHPKTTVLEGETRVERPAHSRSIESKAIPRLTRRSRSWHKKERQLFLVVQCITNSTVVNTNTPIKSLNTKHTFPPRQKKLVSVRTTHLHLSGTRKTYRTCYSSLCSPRKEHVRASNDFLSSVILREHANRSRVPCLETRVAFAFPFSKRIPLPE